MGLSRTVSEIDGDFSQKWQDFSSRRVFCPSLTGFPLKLGIGAWVRKIGMMGLPDGPKSFKIGLAVQTQYRRVTDRHPDTLRQQ